MNADQFAHSVLSSGHYVIDTELAELWNSSSGERVRQWENKSGYKTVTLSFRGKTKTLLVHRLVAIQHFGPEAVEGLEVHHLDERRTDNSCYNILPVEDSTHKTLHLLKGKEREALILEVRERLKKNMEATS